MDDVVTMTEFDGFQQLVDIDSHLVEVYTVRVLFKNFKQVFLQILEDQIETVHSKNKGISLTEWLVLISYFLKQSTSVTMFSCFRLLSILTSLKVVFFTISSSSDSLNFFMATVCRES